jgi:hypothetical protein
MSGPHQILVNAWYDERTLSQTLGVTLGSLDRARLAGDLRYSRKAGRILFLGEWVQQWLTREEPPRPTRRRTQDACQAVTA